MDVVFYVVCCLGLAVSATVFLLLGALALQKADLYERAIKKHRDSMRDCPWEVSCNDEELYEVLPEDDEGPSCSPC